MNVLQVPTVHVGLFLVIFCRNVPMTLRNSSDGKVKLKWEDMQALFSVYASWLHSWSICDKEYNQWKKDSLSYNTNTSTMIYAV